MNDERKTKKQLIEELEELRAKQDPFAAQLREAAERVRSEAVSMRHSDDLLALVGVMFGEVQQLGLDVACPTVVFLNPEADECAYYNSFPNPAQYGISWTSPKVVAHNDEIATEVGELRSYNEWLQSYDGKTWQGGTAWVDRLMISEGDARQTAEELGMSRPVLEWTKREVTRASVPFERGLLKLAVWDDHPQLMAVAEALTDALSLGYVRFLDLQAAEDRIAQSAREAAYERVRSAVLASRNTEDILSAASLMEQELRNLGVRADAAAINLIDDDEGTFRQFAASEVLAVDQPDSPRGPSADLLEHWRRREVFHRPATAEWRERVLHGLLGSSSEWRSRLETVKCVVDVPFEYGTLVMNSTEAEEFSEEEIDILQGFAEVISLAYTRYLDFEKLEAQNREIQEYTRNKSEFLSRMSHDLRTPMNAIIGYTRILLRRARGTLEDRQFRNLENIQTSATNLLNLINEILDLSRIEAGRIELKPAAVDVGKLVGECITSVAPLVKPGVELVQELGDVPAIRTDADRIRRVVMNLLGNAVKFTEEGSITISLKAGHEGCELTVADTGVGIPAEDLPLIFEDFHQVERQVGEKVEGTGLGLAIAKKSVDMLGGTISAESEVGEGTSFILRIVDCQPADS